MLPRALHRKAKDNIKQPLKSSDNYKDFRENININVQMGQNMNF
jgi:transcriptional regulator